MPVRLRPIRLLLPLLVLAACQREAPTAPGTASPPASAAPVAVPPAPPASAGNDARALQDVQASMQRFLDARSFHAVMRVEGARAMHNQLDFVAPDRYRMVMAAGTQIIIGDTMYMEMEGKRLQVPLPKGTLAQWRDPLRIREGTARLRVERLGEELVEGQPTTRYRIHHEEADAGESGDFLYWIGDDRLPVQIRQSGQAEGGPYTMTLLYSRFNDPDIDIQAP